MILQILQLHYALLQVLFLCLARITFEFVIRTYLGLCKRHIRVHRMCGATRTEMESYLIEDAVSVRLERL